MTMSLSTLVCQLWCRQQCGRGLSGIRALVDLEMD